MESTKKKNYVSPFIEVVKVSVESALMALSSSENGIHWGGNASENGNPVPDIKGQGDWDIWN